LIAERAGRGSAVLATGPAAPAFHADIAKASRLLGWPPVSLRARLGELAEGWKESP